MRRLQHWRVASFDVRCENLHIRKTALDLTYTHGHSLDDIVNLRLYAIVNIHEASVGLYKLCAVRVCVGLDGNVIVRRAVSKVQRGGEGKVCFYCECSLSEQAFPTDAGVRDEEACLGGVKDLPCTRQVSLCANLRYSRILSTHPLSSIDQFANLKGSGPHCPVSTCNRRTPFSIVKHFMSDD